jgi:hypothetical protein
LAIHTIPVEGSNVRLLGCPDVDVLTIALKNITNSDWREISETQLRSMWPMELSGRSCNAGSCDSLQRNDRVISDACQCCEIFYFVSDKGTKQLEDIVVWYSTDERSDAVAAGKRIAEALGLPPTESRAVGRKRVNTYWTVNEEAQIVAFMEVNVVRQARAWAVYVDVSRQQHP